MLKKILMTIAVCVVCMVPAKANNKSFLLISGNHVTEHVNANKRVVLASLTKMMTIDIVLGELQSGHIHRTDMVTISRHASSMPKSHLGLRAGSKISVNDAIKAVTVHSSNDIAVALAEFISGSEDEFVKRMNLAALSYGMMNTTYFNASGLPGLHQNTSTDCDLVRLYEHMQSYDLKDFGLEEWHYRGETYGNTNHLMSVKSHHMDFSKTGYIDASGYNLVASGLHQGVRYIVVITGCGSSAERDQIVSRKLHKLSRLS
ncbi:D-alanyl-D-alanine carboxypeptidase family protein (plasmid) [Komagataeibacter intermedius]|uniref:D-alanyl-D-alanine carboxypeptidase family protein n=1 Tax=Komagataeibacter intermedius TaxID=66229 RepID=UPI004035E66C